MSRRFFRPEKAPVETIAKLYIAYLVIIARATIEQVDTYLRRINAEVELLAKAILRKTNILDIESISEKEPSPTEVWANLGPTVRSQRDALTIASQDKTLVSAGYLSHHSKLVVIRFDVLIVKAVELAHRSADNAQLIISTNGIEGKRIRLDSTSTKTNHYPKKHQ